jgi:predicted O-methyltransferase YrrM
MCDEPEAPELVRRAVEAAAAAGFECSCLPATGRLLAALAAAKPGGRLAESGTGHGVGTAWLSAGMAGPAGLVTVEQDPARAEAARALRPADPRVSVLTGDWTLLREHGPFDVFFCDGGGKRDDPAGVIDLLAPGGVLVMDDFAPSTGWPPLFDGRPDELRLRYLLDDRLVTAEVQVAADVSVVLGTRR